MSAATITSVTITGAPADPLFTITGTGFLPVPTSTSSAAGGSFTGLDYGNQLSLVDTSVHPPFLSFQAGYDFGGGHDTVGLSGLSYSDTLISFHLGSEYTLFDFPNKIYGVNVGDTVTVFVHGASASTLVTPEPSSMVLVGTSGLLGLAGLYRKRRAARN